MKILPLIVILVVTGRSNISASGTARNFKVIHLPPEVTGNLDVSLKIPRLPRSHYENNNLYSVYINTSPPEPGSKASFSSLSIVREPLDNNAIKLVPAPKLLKRPSSLSPNFFSNFSNPTFSPKKFPNSVIPTRIQKLTQLLSSSGSANEDERKTFTSDKDVTVESLASQAEDDNSLEANQKSSQQLHLEKFLDYVKEINSEIRIPRNKTLSEILSKGRAIYSSRPITNKYDEEKQSKEERNDTRKLGTLELSGKSKISLKKEDHLTDFPTGNYVDDSNQSESKIQTQDLGPLGRLPVQPNDLQSDFIRNSYQEPIYREHVSFKYKTDNNPQRNQVEDLKSHNRIIKNGTNIKGLLISTASQNDNEDKKEHDLAVEILDQILASYKSNPDLKYEESKKSPFQSDHDYDSVWHNDNQNPQLTSNPKESVSSILKNRNPYKSSVKVDVVQKTTQTTPVKIETYRTEDQDDYKDEEDVENKYFSQYDGVDEAWQEFIQQYEDDAMREEVADNEESSVDVTNAKNSNEFPQTQIINDPSLPREKYLDTILKLRTNNKKSSEIRSTEQNNGSYDHAFKGATVTDREKSSDSTEFRVLGRDPYINKPASIADKVEIYRRQSGPTRSANKKEQEENSSKNQTNFHDKNIDSFPIKNSDSNRPHVKGEKIVIVHAVEENVSPKVNDDQTVTPIFSIIKQLSTNEEDMQQLEINKTKDNELDNSTSLSNLNNLLDGVRSISIKPELSTVSVLRQFSLDYSQSPSVDNTVKSSLLSAVHNDFSIKHPSYSYLKVSSNSHQAIPPIVHNQPTNTRLKREMEGKVDKAIAKMESDKKEMMEKNANHTKDNRTILIKLNSDTPLLSDNQKVLFIRPSQENMTSNMSLSSFSANISKSSVTTLKPVSEKDKKGQINIGQPLNITTLEAIPNVTKTLKTLLLKKTGINAKKEEVEKNIRNTTVTTENVSNEVVRERIRLLRLLKEHKQFLNGSYNADLSYMQVSLPVTLSQILSGKVKVGQDNGKGENYEEKENKENQSKSQQNRVLFKKIFELCLSDEKNFDKYQNARALEYLCSQLNVQQTSEGNKELADQKLEYDNRFSPTPHNHYDDFDHGNNNYQPSKKAYLNNDLQNSVKVISHGKRNEDHEDEGILRQELRRLVEKEQKQRANHLRDEEVSSEGSYSREFPSQGSQIGGFTQNSDSLKDTSYRDLIEKQYKKLYDSGDLEEFPRTNSDYYSYRNVQQETNNRERKLLSDDHFEDKTYLLLKQQSPQITVIGKKRLSSDDHSGRRIPDEKNFEGSKVNNDRDFRGESGRKSGESRKRKGKTNNLEETATDITDDKLRILISKIKDKSINLNEEQKKILTAYLGRRNKSIERTNSKQVSDGKRSRHRSSFPRGLETEALFASKESIKLDEFKNTSPKALQTIKTQPSINPTFGPTKFNFITPASTTPSPTFAKQSPLYFTTYNDPQTIRQEVNQYSNQIGLQNNRDFIPNSQTSFNRIPNAPKAVHNNLANQVSALTQPTSSHFGRTSNHLGSTGVFRGTNGQHFQRDLDPFRTIAGKTTFKFLDKQPSLIASENSWTPVIYQSNPGNLRRMHTAGRAGNKRLHTVRQIALFDFNYNKRS